MSAISTSTWRRFLSLLVLVLAPQLSYANSPSYQQATTVGLDGIPSLQLTNTSQYSITAFVMVEFPSLGLEGRTYYDVYTSPRDLLIAPGESIKRPVGHFVGSDASKVRAEVRAVVFEDGSSAGDPVWTNAVLARRVRMFDRLLSVHDLLRGLVGRELSKEAVVDKLRAAEAEADLQLSDDDLRVVDSLVFQGAISTLQSGQLPDTDKAIKSYLRHLEKRAHQIERSRPPLDVIRALPVSVPAPLSEARDPDNSPNSVVSGRPLPKNGQASKSLAEINTPSSPSYCQIVWNEIEPAVTDTITCKDSDNDTVTQSQEFLPEAKFTQYNATTKKTTTVPWSSAPTQWWANGVCYAYTDCDGSHEVDYVEGTDHGYGAAACCGFPVTVDQGQNAQPFWWQFDNYESPSYTQCDPCDSDPGGVEDVASNNVQAPSTTWYFNYACTVTP